MARNEPRAEAAFHELPLVLFTALATAGAGVGAAQLLLGFMGWASFAPSEWVFAVISTLVAVGLLFSVGHLGRPFRGPFALLRLGKSSLSNEVLVVGAVLATSLLSMVLPAGHPLVVPVGFMALVSSFLLLLALGQVYHLPGQLAWAGPARIHPLVLGIAFGLSILMRSLPDGTQARGEILLLVILSVDGLLVWDRARRIGVALSWGVPTRPWFMGRRGASFTLRIVLGILLPAGALLQGWLELAGVFLFLNLFLDRLLFYGLAVRRNTESEVMRAEAALRAGAQKPAEIIDSPTTLIQANER